MIRRRVRRTSSVHRLAALFVTLVALAAVPLAATPAAVAAPAQTAKYLSLKIDSVSPNSVSAATTTVVVKATISNIGDRPVKNLAVRMQRAPKITTDAQMRSMLLPGQQGFDVSGPFENVSDHLNPGQSTSFTLTMATNGPAPSLAINTPGVYPMLLNVNATPEPGIESRLDEARFLLPVTETPGGEVTPPAKPSTAMTLLWPLSDQPHVAPRILYSVPQQLRLVDDVLSKSLVVGGHLNDMLAAVESMAGGQSDRQKRLASAMCLAIDPDLVSTVAAMTHGYEVLDNPARPSGAVHPGTGTAAAVSWLGRLKVLASSMCTIALPFGHTDLTNVYAVPDAELHDLATKDGVAAVENVLGVKTLPGVTWPENGMIDANAATAMRAGGTTTVLLARDAITDSDGAGVAVPDLAAFPDAPAPKPSGLEPVGPPLHAASIDVYTATALAAVGEQPITPVFTPERVRFTVGDDSRAARLQDAVGALTYSSLAEPPDVPHGLLLAPAQSWVTDANEAHVLLTQVSDLLADGHAVARPLAQLVATPPAARSFAPDYFDRADTDGPGPDVRGEVTAQSARLDILEKSMVDNPQAALKPTDVVAPLRQELLRVLAVPGPAGASSASVVDAGRARRAQLVHSIDGLFGSVTVLAPSGVYTLASEQSPLPLVARNDLPIAIRVRVVIDPPPEMTVGDMGLVELPARGSRTLQIPTKISANRKIVLPVELTTAGGHPLGAPAILTVRSNAYGQALALITAGAGTLLLVLAGRRLLRRFRGQPDPADEGRPAPTVHHKRINATSEESVGDE